MSAQEFPGSLFDLRLSQGGPQFAAKFYFDACNSVVDISLGPPPQEGDLAVDSSSDPLAFKDTDPDTMKLMAHRALWAVHEGSVELDKGTVDDLCNIGCDVEDIVNPEHPVYYGSGYNLVVEHSEKFEIITDAHVREPREITIKPGARPESPRQEFDAAAELDSALKLMTHQRGPVAVTAAIETLRLVIHGFADSYPTPQVIEKVARLAEDVKSYEKGNRPARSIQDMGADPTTRENLRRYL